jgi:hypothetical protein
VITLELLELRTEEIATDELLEIAARELELELAGVELVGVPLTTPKGAGCALQVLRAMQLCWFSQPQPLAVVTHKPYCVPYQLQRSPVVGIDDDDELLGVELELALATTEDDLELVDAELRDEDDTATDVFKPKKRIASAAFTGKLCETPCALIASTGAWSPLLP